MASTIARERVIAPWLLGLLAILLGLALYTARPSMQGMTRSLSRQHASDLSITYLQAWLRVQPDSPRLLAILASQYLELGRWDEAYTTSAHLVQLHDPATYNEAIRLQVQAAEQKAFAFSPDSPRRATEVASLVRLLNELVSRDMDVPTMQDLADTAKSVGAQNAGIVLYGRLAKDDPARAAHWYATLGQMALTFGRYELASRAYFKAQDNSPSVDVARDNFLAALRALQSGDMIGIACDAVPQHIGKLANDLAVLRFVIRIAEQADRSDMVIRYGRQMAKQIAMMPWINNASINNFNAVALSGLARIHTASFHPTLPGTKGNTASAEESTNPQTNPHTEEDYNLLYNAFIHSGATLDAQKIAQRALAKPDMNRRLWLKRLATVADWNDEAKIALMAWSALAIEYNDDEAWRRLLVLAPQMEEDHIYLKALLHASTLAPENIHLITEIIGTYERTGNPEGAIAFLEHYSGNRRVTELLAGLAERSGHDELSLKTWRTLQTAYGSNASYALHIASLLYAHMRPHQALKALHNAAAAAHGRAQSAMFWDTYIALARLLGKRSDIEQATRGRLLAGNMTADDYTHLEYLYYGHPVDVARIAEAAFRKTGSMRYLLHALQAYATIHAWHRIDLLLNGLTTTQKKQFDKLPKLLQARATWLLATGRPQRSLQDLRKAYQLPDGKEKVGVSYLWTLLSVGTAKEVSLVTRDIVAVNGNDPDYADVLAAASLQLGKPERALRYIEMQGPPESKDPLWLMTYADVRDALGEPELAWRIRRQAWRILSAKPVRAGNRPPNPDQIQGRQHALVTLGQLFRNGDESMALLMQALRKGPPNAAHQAVARSILGDVSELPKLGALLDPKVQTGRTARKRVDAATNALVLGWALSGEHNALAKAWLARRYVNNMLEPPAAQMALALLADDKEKIATILQHDPANLPVSIKVQAFDRLGLTPQAQTLAFESLKHAPRNDSKAETWQDLALRNPASTDLTIDYGLIDPLQTESVTADSSIRLTHGLGLKLEHIERLNKSTDKSTMPWVPRHDRQTSLAVLGYGQHANYTAQFGVRDGLSTYATGKIAADLALDANWNANIRIGANNYVDNSALLSVGASKNFAAASLSWDSQNSWFANASAEYDTYKVQGGPTLGTGVNYTGEIGYHVRLNNPSLSISAVTNQWRYNARSEDIPELARLMPDGEVPNAATVLPENTFQYGLSITIGNELADQYRHRWAPFLQASWIHDQIQGWGISVRGGIGGSVLGRDRLGLFVSHETAGQGNSQPTTQAGLAYRIFY